MFAIIATVPNSLQARRATHATKAQRGLIMLRQLTAFLSDQSGATAIEYGLIAAGIAVAIIATVQALGTSLNTTFSTVSSSLK
jgi:pilus assembly protein Flp/PilA